MAYKVTWLQTDRVLLVHSVGNLPIEDLRILAAELVACLEAGTAPLHMIADFTEIGTFPTNVLALKGAVPHLGHPKLGWSIVVGGPALARTFAEIAVKIFSVPYRMFRTMDEAAGFLAAQNKALGAMK